MTRFLASELAKDHWYSIAAARRDLNYRPDTILSQQMDDMIRGLRG
jgi:hypothetical protein